MSNRIGVTADAASRDLHWARYLSLPMRRCSARSFLFAVFLFLPLITAGACTLCIGYPEKSAADVLIESWAVALAREDPQQPFTLAPVEFLKGDDSGGNIDLFLDSRTRRLLAGDPSRTVVVVQGKKGDPWRRLALAGAEYETMVRRILLVAPRWRGSEGRLKRAEFFLPWFGHKDPAIYDLAYLEIARAPYPVIKRISSIVAREQIAPILNRPQYLRWRWLAILMLAHCGDAKDKHDILHASRDAERFRLSINLAAWAAASIEIEGASREKKRGQASLFGCFFG